LRARFITDYFSPSPGVLLRLFFFVVRSVMWFYEAISGFHEGCGLVPISDCHSVYSVPVGQKISHYLCVLSCFPVDSLRNVPKRSLQVINFRFDSCLKMNLSFLRCFGYLTPTYMPVISWRIFKQEQDCDFLVPESFFFFKPASFFSSSSQNLCTICKSLVLQKVLTSLRAWTAQAIFLVVWCCYRCWLNFHVSNVYFLFKADPKPVITFYKVSFFVKETKWWSLNSSDKYFN